MISLLFHFSLETYTTLAGLVTVVSLFCYLAFSAGFASFLVLASGLASAVTDGYLLLAASISYIYLTKWSWRFATYYTLSLLTSSFPEGCNTTGGFFRGPFGFSHGGNGWKGWGALAFYSPGGTGAFFGVPGRGGAGLRVWTLAGFSNPASALAFYSCWVILAVVGLRSVFFRQPSGLDWSTSYIILTTVLSIDLVNLGFSTFIIVASVLGHFYWVTFDFEFFIRFGKGVAGAWVLTCTGLTPALVFFAIGFLPSIESSFFTSALAACSCYLAFAIGSSSQTSASALVSAYDYSSIRLGILTNETLCDSSLNRIIGIKATVKNVVRIQNFVFKGYITENY